MLISPNHMPAAITSQASDGPVNSVNKVGLCFIVPNGAGHNPQSAENVIEPRVAMAVYFAENGAPALALADISMPEIASSPTHGQLVSVDQGNYVYLPNSGYFGLDKASISVRVNGYPIRLIFYFQSIDSMAIGNTTYDRLCRKGDSWKISFSPGTLNPKFPLYEVAADKGARDNFALAPRIGSRAVKAIPE